MTQKKYHLFGSLHIGMAIKIHFPSFGTIGFNPFFVISIRQIIKHPPYFSANSNGENGLEFFVDMLELQINDQVMDTFNVECPIIHFNSEILLSFSLIVLSQIQSQIEPV